MAEWRLASKGQTEMHAFIYLISWGSGSKASAGYVRHQIFHAPQRDILIDTPSSGHSFQRKFVGTLKYKCLNKTYFF